MLSEKGKKKINIVTFIFLFLLIFITSLSLISINTFGFWASGISETTDDTQAVVEIGNFDFQQRPVYIVLNRTLEVNLLIPHGGLFRTSFRWVTIGYQRGRLDITLDRIILASDGTDVSDYFGIIIFNRSRVESNINIRMGIIIWIKGHLNPIEHVLISDETIILEFIVTIYLNK